MENPEVYFHRPDPQLISQLDALFARKPGVQS